MIRGDDYIPKNANVKKGERTPGPWFTSRKPGEVRAGQGPNTRIVADCYAYSHSSRAGGAYTPSPENAHLIAAAPDLLEAAKGALARYPELNALRAAVEKAGGAA